VPSNENNHLKIALLGNPNSGKSSVFNALTGLSQKTGNYAGVTVDRQEGKTSFSKNNSKITLSIIDLPGIYSLFPKSNDELIACKTLLDENENIDVIVIVADASNLKRNLLLATQLIDLKFKTVLALNMMDEAENQNIHIDTKELEKITDVSVIPLDSRRKKGFDTLKEAILKAKTSNSVFYNLTADYLLNHNSYKDFILNTLSNNNKSNFAKEENDDKLYRYNSINYIIAKCVKSPNQLTSKQLSSKIDKFATHKIFGYLTLLTVLFLVFQFIFYVSEIPMTWIETGFINLGNYLHHQLPEGQLNDLIVNGLIAGISGVIMFIPQIAFLFMFISFLEDSGYMARAGFIMDKIMRPFGLNGKSVIPLISGTACAVPAIMATRTISNTKERLITVFILPLISCSARLPVYTLLISVMYPDNTFLGVFNSKGLVLFLLYFIGFFATMITAFFLKKILKTTETSSYIMELPVYRWPQARNIFLTVFTKVNVFIKEAGLIILSISVLLWFLSTHGSNNKFKELEASKIVLEKNTSSDSINSELNKIETQKLEYSYIGQFGHLIEPVIKPLGYDWKIGIALITSFAAREVFVGTMATIYQSNKSDEDVGIKNKLLSEKNENNTLKYTPAVCWSLLLFYAFALQCMSTIAVVKRETKSWSWVVVQVIFMFAIAYFSAFSAYKLLS
jgi:ferrous iron transport protein B